MSATTLPTLQSSRPEIRVEGSERAQLSGGLFELAIEETAEGLYHCEALFNNWGLSAGGSLGFLYFGRDLLDFGKAFAVHLQGQTLFDGRISALEAVYPAGGASMLRVFAEDRLQDLRMTRRTRSFSDLSDADVLRRIAGEHGLQAEVNLQGPTHKILAQVNQSDLAFARERCRALGAELWVQGTKLKAAQRADRSAAALTLVQGARLHQFSVRADLAQQHTALILSGWDIGAKKALKQEAGASSLAGEIGGDDSGATLLDRAFGQRKQSIAHTVPLGGDEARAHAQAEFRNAARRFVTGCGVADSDPALRVGAAVDLQGLGPLFNGRYGVIATRLRFDSQLGLRTEFSVERAGLGKP